MGFANIFARIPIWTSIKLKLHNFFARLVGGKRTPTIKEAAAREAIERRGLLESHAIPTIVQLLESCMREHPRAITTAYRKEGEQISAAEKKQLGIRANAFLSRKALAEIAAAGLADPLAAHETTLLRATFTVSRHDCVARGAQLKEQFGEQFVGFLHETLHRNCAACNRLDGLVSDEAAAAIFPPADCSCPTANYGIRYKIDWLAGIE